MARQQTPSYVEIRRTRIDTDLLKSTTVHLSVAVKSVLCYLCVRVTTHGRTCVHARTMGEGVKQGALLSLFLFYNKTTVYPDVKL